MPKLVRKRDIDTVDYKTLSTQQDTQYPLTRNDS